MGSRKRIKAAAAAAAAVFICVSCAAAAPAGEASGGARWLLFSGSDVWRNGSFFHGGLLWSPAGLDREGFTLKAVISGGRYRYISGALGNVEVTGRELAVQIMPGARFKRGKLEIKVFAGLDIQDHSLSPDDPSSELRGGDAGARLSFDLWHEPTPQTMLAADGSLSSIAASYSARAAAGWRMFDRFYVGPEAQAFASEDYRQTQIGVHLTGLKTGDLEWSAALGWANDSDNRDGLYGRFGISARR